MPHTPGPWEAERVATSVGHAWKINPIAACIYVDHTTDGLDPQEAADNARLIRTAPELLERLQHTATLFHQDQHADLVPDLADCSSAICELNREAIGRALTRPLGASA